MTLSEVQASLVFAKAAYNAALEGGSTMSWNGRTISLLTPKTYREEIVVLERQEQQLSSSRKGHNYSLADFR